MLLKSNYLSGLTINSLFIEDYQIMEIKRLFTPCQDA